MAKNKFRMQKINYENGEVNLLIRCNENNEFDFFASINISMKEIEILKEALTKLKQLRK